MSQARKCDRCQCFFEGSTTKNPDAKIEISANTSEYRNVNPFGTYSTVGVYDLCPSCYEEFKKFMLMTGVDKNE